MTRYKLTDGTYIDVDPLYEEMFLGSNPGAEISIEEDDIAIEDSEDQELAVSISEDPSDDIVTKPLSWQENAAKLKAGREKDANLIYEFQSEGDVGAWAKSTDAGKTFEVVDDGNIPSEWFEDPRFVQAYNKETEGFEGEGDAKTTALSAFWDTDLPLKYKIAASASALFESLKDPNERAQIKENFINIKNDMPLHLANAWQQSQAMGIDYLRKTAGEDATDFLLGGDKGSIIFIDPDNNKDILFSENPDRWKELNKLNVNRVMNVKRIYKDTREEVGSATDTWLVNKYKEIEALKLLYTYDGKGMVKGVKTGDISDVIGGVMNSVSSMIETMGPAVVTRGASLFPQIAGPMYTDYNTTKAEFKYGKDNPDAIKKLVTGKETEVLIPASLGLFATGLEYVGLKGVTKYIGSTPGKSSQFAKLLWVGNGEGATEVGQLGLETVNTSLAGGKNIEEASADAWDTMISEEGLEMYLSGMIGSTTISATGNLVNRALRSDKASIKEVNDKINNIADLNNAKYSTKDKDVRSAIDLEIKAAEENLKNYIIEKRKLSKVLTKEEEISLINTLNEKDGIKEKAEALRVKLENGNITNKEFGYAIRSLNNQDKKLSDQLSEIQTAATTRVAEKVTETVKEQIKESGLEGKVTEMTSEEISNIKEEGFDSKTAAGEFGFIRQNTDGSFEIILNIDKPMIGTAAHEFMHAVLFKTLGNNQNLQDNLGDALVQHTSKLGGETSVLGERLSAYGKWDGDTFVRDANFGEETITIMSEEIINGNLKFNENFFTKIGDIVRRFSQNYLGKEITFDTGRDVYNFVKDYSKSIKEGKINKAILKVAKEGAKGKLVEDKVTPEATVQMSKDASDNVQRIYEKQGEAGAIDIIEQFKPIVNKIVERRSQAPNFDRQLLTDEIETGKRGIFDLIREYNPESGVPLAAYINKFLPARAIEASKRVLGEEFVEDITERVDIAAEEVVSKVVTKPKPRKIILSDRLNVKSKVDKAIKDQLPKLDINNLTFKTLKNLVPEITGKMFGISPKKLVSLANITQKELQAAQMFINKNADVLISTLPSGVTASGTSTGIPNTILKAFYTKTDRAKMTKTGSKSGLSVQVKNSNISRKDFLEVFGIVNGKPVRMGRNTSAKVLALANLTGKMMTNQAVREQVQDLTDYKKAAQNIKDGISNVMFSKSAKEFAGRNGYDYIEINTPVEFDNALGDWSLISTYMPGVLRAADLYNWSNKLSNDALRYYMRDKAKQYPDLFTVGGKGKDKAGIKKFPRIDASISSGGVGNDISKMNTSKIKARIGELNEIGRYNFIKFWDGINEAITNNPKNKTLPVRAYYLATSSYNDSSHPVKTGAPLKYRDVTATSKIRFEHAVQNNYVIDKIMDAIAEGKYKEVRDAILRDDVYVQTIISKKNAEILDATSYVDKDGNQDNYGVNMGKDFDLNKDIFTKRFFNKETAANENYTLEPKNIKSFDDGKSIEDKFNINKAGNISFSKSNIDASNILNKAINFSRSINNPTKGITVLDFDDTLATTKSLVRYTAPDGTTGTLNAEEYAIGYQDLLDQGFKFDFSEFNKVIKGKVAPLFQKALKLQGKFGPKNMFVLTARPPQAAKAIFDFLKANGLNIPIKNITGLGNSTAEAKALWIADKVGDGYNDFYFADDALQNVKAVKNMLDQFDVKSKVQQAKVKFSKDMSNDFNNILEEVTGIESEKRFSDVKARKRGSSKGKFRFFIPPSHEDFVGLLYNFIGKGERGNQHRNFFEQSLIRPLNRAYRELDAAKQSIANDYKSLNKQFKDVKKKLTKKTPDGDFTYQDAVRVYLWNKHGHKVPGLNKTDQTRLTELVMADTNLKSYAEALNVISKQDTYVTPSESWEGGDIRTDLDDATGRVGRQQYFAEFNENAEVIFSQENLNKIEATYGEGVVSAIKDILYRTKTGRNRPSGQNELVNRFMNYLNGSVGSVMFFNMRSALLQQMSLVNFINFADNNVFSAAKAFANQPQYWRDWAFIFNSDMIKQRRGGIKTDINGAELAASLRGAKNTPRALVAKLLELGFLPTQIGDNIAIATGGATFYRNRINTYLKQEFSQKEAQEKAWTDFQILAESTQQSARPDMVSQQQASPLGRIVLAFQNVTSQFNRLGKKAFLDIKNRRITPGNTSQFQSDVSNTSRIAYYFAIQNLIFYTLQTALFTMMFDDDEDDERLLKKKERIVNGTLDSVLRGSGVFGAVISTLKNMAIKFAEQRDKGWNKDESAVLMEALNLSPPLGIKGRKITNAEKTLNYNKDVIKEMETFDIDNPQWSAVTNYIEAFTNVPVNRLYNKTQNIREALNNQNSTLQRALMFLGWSKYNLGIEDTKIQEIKKIVKEKKKAKFGEKAKIKKLESKKEQEQENEAVVKENQKKSKKDGICAAVSTSGNRCRKKAVKDGFCTIHEKTEQRKDGKKLQCRKRKSDGTRCKVKTSSKSQYCYYHD